MIRIVKQIFVRSLDTEGEWLLLPLVPTTATLDMGHTPEEAGDLTSYQLEATLRFCPDTARHNLCVKVVFGDLRNGRSSGETRNHAGGNNRHRV